MKALRSGAIVASLVAASGCVRTTPANVRPVPVAVAHDDPRRDFRPTPWEPFTPEIDAPTRAFVDRTVCTDDACRAQCAGIHDRLAYAECAVAVRYREDRAAVALARTLVTELGLVPATDDDATTDAGWLGDVSIAAALPTGEHLTHLQWVARSLFRIEDTLAFIVERAPRAVLFRTRPHAFRFFRTAVPTYPSAWASDGVVGYNIAGPLHVDEGAVAETLFHELVHLNDEGHGEWSDKLAPHLDAVVERCGTDDACLARFAPDDTRVPGGTFYVFDPRTREPREYAADIGLRWFREHAAIRNGAPLEPPFKCLAAVNAEAWSLVVDEFFGGADLTGECPRTRED